MKKIGKLKQNDLIGIMNRIALIDMTNSTNLSKHKQKANIFNIAEAINNANIELEIQKGDPNVVTKIINSINGVKFFSFFSKYCYYVNKFVYDGSGNSYMKYDNVFFPIILMNIIWSLKKILTIIIFTL